ncbi:secretin N-terminal domain-containing protein [Urbifossiella limnaea]|uniref:Type II secretion system protein D n=1 Tax=Urbifossiella limnaea TaxID=2528023 RepID=A0A517Y2L9_9BACT|nr:secretin N-terminal domain-containing protein [Urbifossiella limnaea]QDU24017.1 Putative type II secretion system protein D precursor [Urbifossiella limnaea]
MLETLFVAAVLGAGGPPAPPTAAPAERPIEEVRPRAYQLKSASAQLAAPAVAADLRTAGLTARIAFDLPSNTLFVQGSAAAHARVDEFLPQVEEGARTELRVFRLQHASADAAAQVAVERLTTSGVPVQLVPDARNNAFVISGSRAMQARAAAVVASFDLEPMPVAVPAAPAPREVPVVTAAYQLRNVAAADAAVAVGRALGTDREFRINLPENQLVVQGSPATHAAVAALVGELDRTPPQVVIQALVAQVPPAFLDDCGLTKAGGVFSLGKRERVLFNVALRHYPTREILARPELLVRDGQTGHFQVGPSEPVVPAGAVAGTVTGLSARITPRIMPDGKVLLRVEPQVRSVAAPVVAAAGVRAFPVNVQSVQTTVLAADGETVVLVGPTTTGTDGKPTALLFVLTPSVVKSEKP